MVWKAIVQSIRSNSVLLGIVGRDTTGISLSLVLYQLPHGRLHYSPIDIWQSCSVSSV